MKRLFANSKDFEPDERDFGRTQRTDDELRVLRQSVITGAYIVEAVDIADALLSDAWLANMTRARPRH